MLKWLKQLFGADVPTYTQEPEKKELLEIIAPKQYYQKRIRELDEQEQRRKSFKTKTSRDSKHKIVPEKLEPAQDDYYEREQRRKRDEQFDTDNMLITAAVMYSTSSTSDSSSYSSSSSDSGSSSCD